MSKLFKVLVTGTIGSGKSTACKLFEELAVPVYYSDLQAKKIMDSNPIVIMKIKDAFGDDIYVDGVLDRKKLASIVFNDKDKLETLNSIVHPVVSSHFDTWCRTQRVFNDSPYVIEESAIAIETGALSKFDYIIVVTADEHVRIRRTMSRDNCSEEKVRDRMKNQLPEDEKIKYADFVIVNNDFPNLKCQVKTIHENILEIIKKQTNFES